MRMKPWQAYHIWRVLLDAGWSTRRALPRDFREEVLSLARKHSRAKRKQG